MSSCSLWRACTAAWWPGWGWGAPSAWRGPSECRGSSRRGSSAPCPPANTRVTRDFGDPRDTCHVTAAALSCTWRAGLLIWLWMHFIFYHKLISIHAALRQFVFRGDNTMDPAFRSSRNKQKGHVYKISLSYPTEKLILFQMRKRETESVSFPRQCLKGEVIFRQWPPIKISTVPTSRHPSSHCCERSWSVCHCTQHTLSTELIMLIGSQTFPQYNILLIQDSVQGHSHLP